MVLKPANDVTFLRHIKVGLSIKHYKRYSLVLNVQCVTHFCDIINNAWPESSDMRHIR